MHTEGCVTLALKRGLIAEPPTSEELAALKTSMLRNLYLDLESSSAKFEAEPRRRRRRDRTATVARPSAPTVPAVDFPGVPLDATVAAMDDATKLELWTPQVATSSFSGGGSSHATPIASGSGVASYDRQTQSSGAWYARNMQANGANGANGEHSGNSYYQRAPLVDALAPQAYAQDKRQYDILSGAAMPSAPYQNFYPAPMQSRLVAPHPDSYTSTTASLSSNHAAHPASSQMQYPPNLPAGSEAPMSCYPRPLTPPAIKERRMMKMRKYVVDAGPPIPPRLACGPQQRGHGRPAPPELSWTVSVPGAAGPAQLDSPNHPKRKARRKHRTQPHGAHVASSSATAPAEEAEVWEASAEHYQVVAPLEAVNDTSSSPAETVDGMGVGNEDEQLSPVGTTPAYSTDDSPSSAEQSPQYPATPSDEEFGELLAAEPKEVAEAYFEIAGGMLEGRYVAFGQKFGAAGGFRFETAGNDEFQPDATWCNGEVPTEGPWSRFSQ
ncbi:hypothetical protein C8R46DRAFT_1084580 [Mycena filopes]|nr:hypothetical protein C8R46DRAFT_1084580 [Mycena filopes]